MSQDSLMKHWMFSKWH